MNGAWLVKKILIVLSGLMSLGLVNNASASSNDSKSNHYPRIIALAPHIVENLYQVGAGQYIIGTTEHADYPEQANRIKRVGNYAKLNIEQILAMAPDVIIAWKTGNPSDDLARLAQMGIEIIYSDPHYLEDVAAELTKFAKIAGTQAQGEQAAKRFLARLTEIKAAYQDKTTISGFYELWPRPLTTVANDAWPQQQLEVCGVDNPFKESATDYPQINLEQVILHSPKIIIQPTSHGSNQADAIDWRQWPSIPAVKANAFLQPDADKMHRMTSRALDELALFCQQVDQLRAQLTEKTQ
ncbi:cobalamin-binding protein [Thalassotalea ganghwensis]